MNETKPPPDDTRSLHAQLWHEAHRIMTLKGLLRVISKESQQLLDVFEGHYGIRGASSESLSCISERWEMSVTEAEQLLEKTWEKLKTIRAPIKNALDLQGALRTIRNLELHIGDGKQFNLTSILPTAERLKEILRLQRSTPGTRLVFDQNESVSRLLQRRTTYRSKIVNGKIQTIVVE